VDARRNVSTIPAMAMLVGASAAAAGLGYAWTLLAGRLLAPYEYSDFSAAVSIIYFGVTALAPLWQTTAAFTAAGGGGGALERRLLRLLGASGALLILLTVALASPLASLLRLRSAADGILICLAIVIVGMLHVRRGVQLGEGRFAVYSRSLVVEALLRVILAVTFLHAAHTAASGLGSYVISVALALMIAGRLSTKGDADVDLAAVGRYFVPIFVYSAAYAGFQNLDVVLVKQWFPAADAGVYGAASFLARGVGMLVMPFYAFAVPHLAEAASDWREVRRRFIGICLQYVALATVALVLLGTCSRFLVMLLFGPAYAAAAPLLLPLGTAIALGGLAFLFGQLPLATNRFGFIGAYAPALLLEVALLAGFHRTLPEVALTLIAANVVTLLSILPFLRRSPGPFHYNHPDAPAAGHHDHPGLQPRGHAARGGGERAGADVSSHRDRHRRRRIDRRHVCRR
jgi:O-antigen/teichoic acid export membrane protein